MPPRREIPGFYFDEERQRYFAIPRSSTVSDFNSPEIRKLDKKIQSVKQKENEAADKRKPLSPLDKQIVTLKKKQEEKYESYRKIQERYRQRGYIHEKLKRQLLVHGNDLDSFHLYQNLELYTSLHLRFGDDNICGFAVLLEFPDDADDDDDDSDPDVVFVIYLATPEGEVAHWMLENQLPTEVGRRMYDRPDRLEINRCSMLNDDMKPLYFVNSRNNVEIISKSVIGKEGDFLNSEIECSTDLGVCWISEENQRFLTFYTNLPDYVLPAGETVKHETIRIKKEVLCMNSIERDRIVVTGDRSGRISIYKDMRLCLKIEIGTPLCGIELFEFENGYLCVVSGLNDKLLSYYIDSDYKNATLHTVFTGYYWNERVSHNLRRDDFNLNTTFAVESQIPGDDEKLEIKFYSIYCPNPLKTSFLPICIPNISSSSMLWSLVINCLVIYDKDTKRLNFYRDFIHFEQRERENCGT